MIYVHDRGRKTGRQTETRSVNETTNHFHAYYTHFCFKETAERKNCTKLLQTVTQVLENKDLLGEIAYRSLDEIRVRVHVFPLHNMLVFILARTHLRRRQFMYVSVSFRVLPSF